MTLYDFKAQINDTESDEEADELCLQWLKAKAEKHPRYMDELCLQWLKAKAEKHPRSMDELCLQWLTAKAEGYGNEGRAAVLLLQAYEILTS